VFLDLVHELERQGVSRKVSADMFGLGLRTYQRKIQRFLESSTDRGRSLWVSVLDYVQRTTSVTRAEVLAQFANDDESQVRGVLRDLCESGLIATAGSGARVTYRLTSEDEQARLRQAQSQDGLDELVWALIYREGPCTLTKLQKAHVDVDELAPALSRLLSAGRIEQVAADGSDGSYTARSLVLPLGSSVGWEAAVFDHFKAVVNTVTRRLGMARKSTALADRVGGSTYTVDVWPGHPHAEQAYETLRRLRSELGSLRDQIERYNADHPVPERYTQVLLYAGQCLIEQGEDEADEA
jgi:DNA-binding PadR family transcriptional regulator